MEQKRYDPVEGRFYNLIKERLPQKSVMERLIQLPEHTQPLIKQRLIDYRNFLVSVENEFRQLLIRISMEDTQEKIFINFCDAIEHTV